MEKNFDQWNKEKKHLQKNNNLKSFHEREFWWAKVGVNIGFEQDGKGENNMRPVLIIKKFNKNSFLGLPLTSNNKKGKYYFGFHFKGKFSNAILSQIRLFDSKRLFQKEGKVSENVFLDIKKEIKKLFDE